MKFSTGTKSRKTHMYRSRPACKIILKRVDTQRWPLVLALWWWGISKRKTKIDDRLKRKHEFHD